ncbi:membrane protein insertase YidC [bacterium]|nr:membrane protein insertase YidC [bacterium]
MSALVGTLPQLDLTVDSKDYSQLGDLVGSIKQLSDSEYEWSAENEVARVVRKIKISANDGYADITYAAEFKKERPGFAFVSLVSDQQASPDQSRDRNLVYYAGDQHRTTHASEAVKLTDVLLPVKWIGVENRYFLLAAVDLSGTASALLQPLAGQKNRIALVYRVSGSRIDIPVRVFFGPKSVDILKSVHPSLDHAVEFGILSPLAYGILRFMKWLFSFSGNYGVAIILLTVALKLLLYPLTFKGAKSMKKMSVLQPQMQKLKERYKDDKETLNREMLLLMKNSGANPIGGCLPMLIQMPIFFALYQVLYRSFELYRAPFGLWIHDLSLHDPFYVTPVLLTVVMYFQSKLTPSTGMDPTQQKVMQAMPVIFGVFMLSLPSGLTIYMLTNAVVSIIQQIMINKKLGIQVGPVASATT